MLRERGRAERERGKERGRREGETESCRQTEHNATEAIYISREFVDICSMLFQVRFQVCIRGGEERACENRQKVQTTAAAAAAATASERARKRGRESGGEDRAEFAATAIAAHLRTYFLACGECVDVMRGEGKSIGRSEGSAAANERERRAKRAINLHSFTLSHYVITTATNLSCQSIVPYDYVRMRA